MHKSSCMSAIVYKDKRLMLILSSYVKPNQYTVEFPVLNISQQTGLVQENIQTSPFTMSTPDTCVQCVVLNCWCGTPIDILYYSQNCLHKWWHQIFWFLLNTSIVNTFIEVIARNTSTIFLSQLEWRSCFLPSFLLELLMVESHKLKFFY